ncbi:MAG: hypothetical protein ACK53L_27180, partial [Pirellulaceae bacterium]
IDILEMSGIPGRSYVAIGKNIHAPTTLQMIARRGGSARKIANTTSGHPNMARVTVKNIA